MTTIRSVLARANTHRVFGVGMLTGSACIAVLAAQHQLDAATHLNVGLRILRFWIDGLSEVAWIAIAPALVAAGVGRPTTIK